MDAKISVSLTRLVEAAMKGDTAAVAAYAAQLKARLAEVGEKETAERLGDCLTQRKAKKAGISRVTGLSLPANIPVDSESRLPVADEIADPESPPVYLSADADVAISRFLSCIQNADKLAKHGVSAAASLLMHGPPGCGKTLVARHIASAAGLPLLVARTDSLISSYLGSTSKNLRMLFEHAASRPCVLFLDEFDAIAKMRDDQRELGELKRVVISLLQNIDANGSGYILLAATNHPHLLDAAVWRRFSFTVKIDLPDEDARFKMLLDFLGKSVHKDIVRMVAHVSDGLSGSQLRSLSDDVIRESVLNSGANILPSTVGRFVAERLDDRHGMTDHEAIKTLGKRNGNSISQQLLGEMFGVSQPTVSRILKAGANDA